MPNLSGFCYIISCITKTSGRRVNLEVDNIRQPWAKHLSDYVFTFFFFASFEKSDWHFFSKVSKTNRSWYIAEELLLVWGLSREKFVQHFLLNFSAFVFFLPKRDSSETFTTVLVFLQL